MEQTYQIAGVLVFLLLVTIIFVFLRKKIKPLPPAKSLPGERSAAPTSVPAQREPERVPLEDLAPPKEAPVEKPEAEAVATEEPEAPKSLTSQLSRTRGSLFDRMSRFFKADRDKISENEWEEIEEVLLEGDVGIGATTELLDRVKARLKTDSNQDLKTLIQEESEGMLSGLSHGLSDELPPKPWVISVVGVNGVGKTTTLGKLAQKFQSEGKSVLLGAGDTFRAAAISQLKIWADRTGAQFVTGREGADPGAVAFDAVAAAKARGIDVVLLDTAGRLHTKKNLMDELGKIHRVIKKVIPEAPHDIWIVVDGTLGQNSIHQAREFQNAMDLTGVIITKLDGTSKGGAVLSIVSDLKLPVKFIGVGEKSGDLMAFEPGPFVEAILGSTPTS